MFEDYDIRDKHNVEVHCSNPDTCNFGVCKEANAMHIARWKNINQTDAILRILLNMQILSHFIQHV